MRKLHAGRIRVEQAATVSEHRSMGALPGATPPAAAAVTADAVVEDLQAQVVSLSEANRLLIAAQQELLDALAQFMTPGHLGDMADATGHYVIGTPLTHA